MLLMSQTLLQHSQPKQIYSMNNTQKPCSHSSRSTGGGYKYMMLAVVHPCCFVHNKQDNAAPTNKEASQSSGEEDGWNYSRAAHHLLSERSSVRNAQNNIQRTHHEADGDVEGGRKMEERMTLTKEWITV